MSKAGKKIIAGAREALAIARGKKMPARVTAHGWMLWSADTGLGSTVYPDKPTISPAYRRWTRAVRVRITATPARKRTTSLRQGDL
jgi:hypothetical protein